MVALVFKLHYDSERGNCGKLITDFDSEEYRKQLESYPLGTIVDSHVVFNFHTIIEILEELMKETLGKSTSIKKYQVRQAFARADSQLNGEDILFVELHPIEEERGGYMVSLTEWINVVTLHTQDNIDHFTGEDEKIVEVDMNEYRENKATLQTGESITIYQHNDYIDKVMSLRNKHWNTEVDDLPF